MGLLRQNRHKIPIVYYHSAGPVSAAWNRSYLSLPVTTLEEHFSFISRNFNSVFIGEYYNIRMGRLKPGRRNIIITFDDGYLDNWTWVFPMLKKHGLKATIFISPEFVDPKTKIRPNYDDYKQGIASFEDLSARGFLSWDEMQLMESSGLVDIQSHTMTHTKYFISDRLTGFHYPGGDILYPAGNRYPERKPYYIDDKSFDRLLPYGYPLFEEASSVTAKKVEISQSFINECLRIFEGYNFNQYKASAAFKLIGPLYKAYKSEQRIITRTESYDEYIGRLKYEIEGSKQYIEEKLNKRVDFLCWPHGDNNRTAQEIALGAGYLMTTQGNYSSVDPTDCTRMPDRMCIDLTTPRRAIKTKMKIKAFAGRFPYSQTLFISRKIHFFSQRKVKQGQWA